MDTTPTRTFPQPDTTAHRILRHIEANPGVSVNGLMRVLSINPGPIRVWLRKLEDRGLIEDRLDEREYHHYYAKEETGGTGTVL